MAFNSAGKLKTKLSDMKIGDYINIKYTGKDLSTIGAFSEIGTVDTKTVPEFDRKTAAKNNYTGYITFLKISKGTLFSTKIINENITYDPVNKAHYINGVEKTIDNTKFIIRVPNIYEFSRACGTLDGLLNPDERYTNFDVSVPSVKQEFEIQQENYGLTPGHVCWNTTPFKLYPDLTSAAPDDSPRGLRVVLLYKEPDSKSVDVFH